MSPLRQRVRTRPHHRTVRHIDWVLRRDARSEIVSEAGDRKFRGKRRSGIIRVSCNVVEIRSFILIETEQDLDVLGNDLTFEEQVLGEI